MALSVGSIFFSRIAIRPVSVYFIRVSLVCHLAVFHETWCDLDEMETIPTSRVFDFLQFLSATWKTHDELSLENWWSRFVQSAQIMPFDCPFAEVIFVIDCVNL